MHFGLYLDQILCKKCLLLYLNNDIKTVPFAIGMSPEKIRINGKFYAIKKLTYQYFYAKRRYTFKNFYAMKKSTFL